MATRGSAAGRFAKARLVAHRLFQGDRLGGVLRHQLGELVDLPQRHLQRAPDIAQHPARQERAEGDDLRDAVGAVALADIGDHLVAAVLAEVDVEIRHRHAFRVEKALEQQAEADRIEIGDGQGVGDQRAGARAAPRPDRDVLPLGPLDEVGDDQEIAGKPHLHDDVEFEGEPLLVVLDGEALSAAVIGEALCEPVDRLSAQFADLVERLAGGRGEARQDRLAGPRAECAAHRDLDRVVGGLRQVGEQRDHFRAPFEAVLGRQAPPVAVADQRAVADAQQHVLRLVIGGGGEIGLVARRQRQRMGVGEIDQVRLDGLFRFEVVPLQFDIESPVEQRGEAAKPRPRQIEQPVGQRAVDRPGRTAGQRDQAVGLAERVEPHMRVVAIGGRKPGLRGEPHQVAIARLVLGEQHERRARRARIEASARRGRRVAEIHGDLRADDRLDAGLRQLFGEFQRAEQVVGVGDRQSRHLIGFGELGQRLDGQRALAQRIGGMDVQVHEADGFNQRAIHNSSFAPAGIMAARRRPVEARRPAVNSRSRAEQPRDHRDHRQKRRQRRQFRQIPRHPDRPTHHHALRNAKGCSVCSCFVPVNAPIAG